MIAGALSLAACSGSSPTPTPVPTPTPTPNVAPVFTSATTVSVPENTTGPIYTAIATDANGDAITYSIVGGADQGSFSITAAGALTFVTPPDFENPRDNNADNVYEIAIRANDGRTNTDLPLNITVTDVADQDMRAVMVNDWGATFAQIAPSPVSADAVYLLYAGSTPPTGNSIFYADRVAKVFGDFSGLHAPASTLSFAPSPPSPAMGESLRWPATPMKYGSSPTMRA